MCATFYRLSIASFDTSSRDDPFVAAAGQVRFGMVGCGEIAVLNAEALTLAPTPRSPPATTLVPTLAADLAGRFGAVASPSLAGWSPPLAEAQAQVEP